MVKKVAKSAAAPAVRSRTVEGRPEVQDEGSGIAYQPLESATHFRLIKLLGNSIIYHRDVTCVLRHFDIDSEECPTYTAVSYTWPKEKASTRMFLAQDKVAGKERTTKTSEAVVTEKLASMLRHLRQRNSDRWLWIDAICINQASPEERNEQVKLMGQIYSSANVVVAWLVHEERLDVFRPLHTAFDFIADVLFSGGGDITQYMQDKRSQHRQNAEQQLQSSTVCLAGLCDLVYWTRKWILQEITLAPTVVLQVGYRTMPIKDLESILTTIRETCKPGKRIASPNALAPWQGDRILNSPAARVIALRSRSNAAFSTLNTLLPLCQLHECAEPRDHLYALYNLIGEHKKNLKIDYDLEFLDIYSMSMEFMRAHETLTKLQVVYVNSILLRLLKLSTAATLSALQLESTKPFNITTLLRPHIIPAQESSASQKLRFEMSPLLKIPKWHFRDVKGVLKRQDAPALSIAPKGEPVGPQDLVHFGIPESSSFGLATCRMVPDLAVWQMENSKLAFIISQRTTGVIEIVGRAAMYMSKDGTTLSRSWEDISPSPHTRERVEVQLSMSELFVMSCWAEDLIDTSAG